MDSEKTLPATPPAQPPVTEPATSPATESTPPATPPAAPQVDLEKVQSEVTEQVSKSVLEKIAGALGLNKEEKKTLPTDPDELAKFIQYNAKKGTESVLSERERADQEIQAARETQLTEGAARFQQLWRDQYSELAESGKVPKITDPNDKNDPGNQAKIRILTKLKQIIDDNAAKGVDYVPTLKEVFYENPNVLTIETTTGATVPISGGGRTISNPSSVMPYDKLRETDIEDMVKSKYSN